MIPLLGVLTLRKTIGSFGDAIMPLQFQCVRCDDKDIVDARGWGSISGEEGVRDLG